MREHTRRVVLLMVLAVAAYRTCHATLPCEQSGFCSEGKVTPFQGEISTAEGLRALLQARSYKKEIIFFACSLARLDINVAAVRSVERLGLHNHFFLAMGERVCSAITTLAPRTACAYYANSTKDFGPLGGGGVFYMWHLRYRTIARMARLGYNVLMADGDTTFFNDPYKYLKHPAFSEFTIINQCETGLAGGCTLGNGGLLYFQNCRPDGPSIWVIYEAIDRPLRYHQNEEWLAAHPCVTRGDWLMDQAGLNAALEDAFFGKTLHRKAAEDAHSGKQGSPRLQVIKNAMKQEPVADTRWTIQERPTPAELLPLVGKETILYNWRYMHVPIAPLHPDLQGLANPGPRAGPSAMVHEQLERDCPSCPWWPEPEDRSKNQRAKQLPPEKYLSAPEWLFGNFAHWGRRGNWDATFYNGTIRQVVGHTHVWQWNAKRLIALVYGAYDFDLLRHPEASKHGLKPYPCCNGDDVRLLALHPDAELGWMRGREDLQRVLVGLQQVAKLSGRVVVWPEVPCLPWMGEGKPAKGTLPLYYGMEVLPRGPVERLHCVLSRTALRECSEDGQGMVTPELKDLVRQRGSLLLPGTNNTLALEKVAPARAASGDATTGGHSLPLLTAQQVKQALSKHPHQVVYLAAPVAVDKASLSPDENAAISTALDKCSLTNTQPGKGLELLLQ